MKFQPVVFIPVLLIGITYAQSPRKVDSWLTDPAKSIFFTKQPSVSFSEKIIAGDVIKIDDTKKYQSIDGFGYALTGGSAMNIIKMSKPARAALLKELFATDKNNIGTSYIRLSIGASDLNDHVFSYNDLPAGQTDTGLVHFDLGPDKTDVIPVMKEILAINPKIKILGSPWSPPVWMKTNNDTRGGSLQPRYYDAYAKYFVKYIRAMQKEGIRIDAVTVQNEPLHPGNNPSLLMLAPDQAIFVKDHLGPAFRKANLKTKIIIYDHNADKPEYPISILNDPAAKKYIDGSAFHLYAGSIDALSKVHDAHPDRNLYFTEQWVGAPGNLAQDIAYHVEQLVIGATRNWSRTVIEWNLAADQDQNPHTDRGGCVGCLGAVTINKDAVTRNPAYYTIAHAAKFVRPGSIRIASNMPAGLPNVAFKTPAGKTVVIVLNTGKTEKDFSVNHKGRSVNLHLPPGAVATYSW
jgi:glucosylceramidase